MHELVVPQSLTGRGIHGDEALGKQVVAQPMPAVPVVRRRADRQIDDSEFEVGAHDGPHVGVAGVGPGVILPRLDAVLVSLRNRVESPHLLTGTDIVGPNVTGWRGHVPWAIRDR